MFWHTSRPKRESSVSAALDALHPVRARSVVDDVVQQLLELVRSGALREGDRLPAERELAERLHVARASVRAAVAQLQANGVVATGPGRRGTVVRASWVPDDAADPRSAGRRSLPGAARGPAGARAGARPARRAAGRPRGARAARARRGRAARARATTGRARSRPRAASTA